MSLVNAATIARRELRGGLKGFRIFLLCLLLGVALNLLGRLCGFFACGDPGISAPAAPPHPAESANHPARRPNHRTTPAPLPATDSLGPQKWECP